MKPTVNRKTQEYLNQLEESEKLNEKQGNYYAQKDALDLYIEKNNLKIQRIFFEKEIDLILIALSNREVLKESLSAYPTLFNAALTQCKNYEISPMGIHWPELDVDLSLKGLLESSLLKKGQVA